MYKIKDFKEKYLHVNFTTMVPGSTRKNNYNDGNW